MTKTSGKLLISAVRDAEKAFTGTDPKDTGTRIPAQDFEALYLLSTEN